MTKKINNINKIKGRKLEHILGIKVDSTSKAKVLRFVRDRIKKEQKFYVVTPNPEIVLRAQEDKELETVLNSADISIPDGIGLVMASKFFSLPTPKNPIRRFLVLLIQGLGVGFSALFDKKWLQSELKVIKGRELFIDLITVANKKGWRVFLLGDRQLSAKKAEEKLKLNYRKVDLISSQGPNLDSNANPKTDQDRKMEQKVIGRINKASPQMLFIGFGAPKQERWLAKHFEELNIGGAMVVGGTFDYISGRAKLPPEWIEDAGLEWLWRLFSGSQEVKRVFKAFPAFPLKVFWYKFNKIDIIN